MAAVTSPTRHAASLATSASNRERHQSKVHRAMEWPKPSSVRSNVTMFASVRARMHRPSCISSQLGLITTTRFTRTRHSDIVHPVSLSQLAEARDRVRSFGGYNNVCFVPLTRRRFIAFLKGLENEGPYTELLIVGDTFGLWELTLVEGIEKLDHIITAHQAIFDQLRATGARIKVTMMVGNHDYDLARNPDFAVQLKVYNTRLDKSL